MTAVVGREFFDLVKAIGESKSKQEEDRIIAQEVIFVVTNSNHLQSTTLLRRMKLRQQTLLVYVTL